MTALASKTQPTQTRTVTLPADADRWEVCMTCRWWIEGNQTCHRSPPAVDAVTSATVFPVTAPADWCGEWLGQRFGNPSATMVKRQAE